MRKFFITEFLIGITFLTSISSCDNLYKAGNLVDLNYPIHTELNPIIVQQYMDTLIQMKGFEVPAKWRKFDKLVDLDSIKHKRIYFRENPEEMYLVSFGGMLILDDVYNPKYNEFDWVSERNKISPKDEARIMKRFKVEVLDVIESLAKQRGLTDSEIYEK